MNSIVAISLIILGPLLIFISFQGEGWGEVSSELRTWTLVGDEVWESNAKNKIQAQFIRKTFGRNETPEPQYILKLASGERVWVPENSLSIEDQDFVEPKGVSLRGLLRGVGVFLMFGTMPLSLSFLSRRGGGGSGFYSGGEGGGGCGGGGCGGGCGGGE